MELNNIKAIVLFGTKYNIEYVDHIDGRADGYSDGSTEIVKVENSLPEGRKSSTIWHEVLHLADQNIHIRDDGKDLSETEVDRLATTLHHLLFVYGDIKEK